MLIIVMIGMWSARGGQMAGTTSHLRMGSSGVLLRHTLSGHVQFLAADWKVGMPLGSARSISFLYKSSISGEIYSSASYSLSFASSSQIGW